MARLLVMNGLMDWITSPIESAKSTYNEAIANWQAALAALDAAVSDFNTIDPDNIDDPDLRAQYDTARGHLDLFQGTMDRVSQMRDTIVNWFNSNASTGMGLVQIPVIGWVAIITASVAAAWALVRELRLVYATYTNGQIARQNQQNIAQGLPTVPYVDPSAGDSFGVFGGMSDLAKWAVLGAALFLGYKLLEGHQHGDRS
jgi:hypothetical protein